MKRIFGRGRYANITSTLALIAALGGTSYAAVTLPANSVGSRQIKKNGVTNSDIKNNAVTSAKVKNNTLTGSDINESKLGIVPKAANATNATNAANAANAATVGGTKIDKVQARLATDAAAATVLNDGGLTLTLTCAAGKPHLTAASARDHSLMRGTLVGATAGASTYGSSNLNIADPPIVLFDGPTSARGTTTFAYTTVGGPVVAGTLYVDDSNTYGPFDGCSVTGTVNVTS